MSGQPRPPRRAAVVAVALAAAGLAAPRPAGAQSAVDVQERHLIDIHSLLLDLPPLQAPAALQPGTLGVSVEAVFIPHIDGTVGDKRELTASDHTSVFPRPRLMLGLPAPAGMRAFAGLAYIPPVSVRSVTTNYLALEGGLGFTPGVFRLGVRGHVLYAETLSPVTEPYTRDALETREAGLDGSVGVSLGHPGLVFEPYLGAGVVTLRGRFRVTVDGTVLHSDYTGAALQAGLRLALASRFELVGELDSYPGRLTHGSVRVGYLFGR